MIEIAIDGTAASGKGTLAKKLAKKYGYVHLDTGLLYRKVANELIIKKKHTSTNKRAPQVFVSSTFTKTNGVQSEHSGFP